MKTKQKTVTKRQIGFRGETTQPNEETVRTAVMSPSSDYETVPTERVVKELLDTLLMLFLIVFPVYLALNHSMWWLFMWAWVVPMIVVTVVNRR